MDRLKLCMDALRALAIQSADPNWYLLAEREITQYLQSPEASPQKLLEAIDREAETSQDYVTFWTTMQELVSDLQPDDDSTPGVNSTARQPS
jgi:hypothetical protein